MASLPPRRRRAHHDINDLSTRARYRPRNVPGVLGRRPRGQRLGVDLTVLVLLPLWPFIAYPLQRRHILDSVTRHSVVIALSAPMRFLADRLLRSRGNDGGWGWGPPSAGDREPRRPRSGPPTDAIALTEPHS
ncbi:hypothetical protein [Streptacidiphilus sp. EB129]|uniref:hypothetical protein n=1 Tax=Streptacidiphilus sp. EB129 TaxID=3156262 RepID=UPI00351235D0